MIYKICYALMLVGYLGLTFQAPDIKGKIIGGLLLAANAVIFMR
jgi:hypothetical protein